MNRKLSSTEIREIRQVMTDLCGTDARREAERLSGLMGCSWQYIYKITRDVRPSKRKTRSDKGNRRFSLIENSDTWKCAELVIVDKLTPELAIETAKARGYTDVPSIPTLRNLLAEIQLNKRQRKAEARPHRRFEASAPGEVFQVDCTGLKKRWLDLNTRSVLQLEGIDKNHPNLDSRRERVWQIGLVDDFSRRVFVRYFHTRAITSSHLVRFLLEAFEEMGVPRTLYTDNGSEFKGRHKTAARILNRILENDGGYEHFTHLPNNAQATGKIENFHQWAETMDKLIGLAILEGQDVDLDLLTHFAREIGKKKNHFDIHRSTGQTPMERWYSRRAVVRFLPTEIMQAALLADEFDVKLRADMTIELNKTSYKVPGKRPFVDYIGQTIGAVVPDELDFILITLPGEIEPVEIPKILAEADSFGDFKAHEQSQAQAIRKRLTETRIADRREIKRARKQTGEIAPVPYLNTARDIPADNVTPFPQPERIVTPEEVAKAFPGRVAPSALMDRYLTYWQAVEKYSPEFPTAAACRETLIEIYENDQQGERPESDILAALNAHGSKRTLTAVS